MKFKIKTSLFSEKEQTVLSRYDDIARVASSDFKLIKNFGRVLQYYDEPKFWQYSATINSKFLNQDGRDFQSIASGVSFSSKKNAIAKCLCESMERYCNNAFFNDSTVFVGTYKSLNDEALNPSDVVAFSENQLKNSAYKKFLIDNNSKFSWSEGISLVTGKKTMIPSQLIYLSYHHIPDEPVIYPGISTGTAGGSCMSGALLRGICEIVERDAFMIFYLNKLEASRINLDQINNSRVQKLLNNLERYNMEVFTFDITTDIKIPTCLSIVVNRTGIGKAVALGLKTDLNQITAIIGSIEETFNSRSWLRTEYEKLAKKVAVSDLLKNSDIRTRGLLWYPTEVINKLDFLLKSPISKLKIPTKEIKRTSGQQLKHILNLFKDQKYDILYKDITVPVFKKMDYFVVKTIVPKMQPFYLNENTKLLGGNRLYQIPKKLRFKSKIKGGQLNPFPHPFL